MTKALLQDIARRGLEELDSGNFDVAIFVYTGGISLCQAGDEVEKVEFLLNRAVALIAMSRHHDASLDAEEVLTLAPKNVDARCILAMSLFYLRRYERALETLRPCQRSSDSRVQSLLRKLITCVVESNRGRYDVWTIQQEAKTERRLFHADYYNEDLEVRESPVAGRGIFAKKLIPQGRLLMANKAISSVYVNEVDQTVEFIGSLPLELRNPKHGLVSLELANQLHTMITKAKCGQAIINLEGGPMSTNMDISLSVAEDGLKAGEQGDVKPETLLDIVERNSFSVSHNGVEGAALFYGASFLNHSCMPNTIRYFIGDMMFIRSCVDIPSDSEIFTTYAKVLHGSSVEERAKGLAEREVPIICSCQLCQFERENHEIVSPAVQLVGKLRDKYDRSQVKAGNLKNAIQELEAGVRSLYSLFHYSPTRDFLSVTSFSSSTPKAFSFSRLLKILSQLLFSILRDRDRPHEAINYYIESFRLVKGNLLLTPGAALDAAWPALYIWEYHVQNPDKVISGEIASKWLDSARDLSGKAGGEMYFDKYFGEYVRDLRRKLS